AGWASQPAGQTGGKNPPPQTTPTRPNPPRAANQSINSEAGPVAFAKSPSRTDTSQVNGPPSSFGLFKTTQGYVTDVPSLLITDMVALGGSVAKLLLPTSHCLMNSEVSTCPAALTGRSANTRELGDTSLNVSLLPCRIAPFELRTARDGTISA